MHAAVARMLGSLLSHGDAEGIFWAVDFGWSQAEDREIVDALLVRAGPGASLFKALRFGTSDRATLTVFVRIALDFDCEVVRPDHRLVVHIDHDQWIDIHCVDESLRAEVETLIAFYRYPKPA